MLVVDIFMCKLCDIYSVDVRMINLCRFLEFYEENIVKVWFF